MGELAKVLRYLLSRVPPVSQAEHDAIAALIDGLEAVTGSAPTQKENEDEAPHV